jgi:hypothetical protein
MDLFSLWPRKARSHSNNDSVSLYTKHTVTLLQHPVLSVLYLATVNQFLFLLLVHGIYVKSKKSTSVTTYLRLRACPAHYLSDTRYKKVDTQRTKAKM